MFYKPTLGSMIKSTLYRFSGGIFILAYMYFYGEDIGKFIWTVSWIALIIPAFLAIESILIHTTKLYVDNSQIVSHHFLHKNKILWHHVIRAELRERENVLSGVDRLLILQSPQHLLSYPLSILKNSDQQHIIKLVREKVNLVVEKDRPTL